MRIGAHYKGGGSCEFVVWAPFVKKLDLIIISRGERPIPMEQLSNGYWSVSVDNVTPGGKYLYKIDNEYSRPDPASFFQPDGVHAPSCILDHFVFNWDDVNFYGIRLSDMVIYEIHVGTFTKKGTFNALIPRLKELYELGINAIELMPVAQFPGERNWGYDGVYPFSVQNSYGGPYGLKELINAAHKNNMAVILDVVCNHLGPEGNYLNDFGPYFTDKYKTPWGMAINFDDVYNNEVRNYFIENALYWFKHFHIDAIRIDAIHGIYDMSAKPFLRELSERVDTFSKNPGRKFYLIAESDLNDSKAIRSVKSGGYELDAQWDDDFHHAIHTLLTGEENGYYEDFGALEHFVKALREGFVYSGQYSKYRKRPHGNSASDLPANRFVVFSQNHDQVGNRPIGERLSRLVSFEALKLAAGSVFLSPYIPLIFMGEEYAEDAPFLYFISHTDKELIKAVREGRKSELKAFGWQEDIPDPYDINTFLRSKIGWEKREEGKHNIMLKLYKKLISLRRELPALGNLDNKAMEVSLISKEKAVTVRRWKDESEIFYILNFSKEDISFMEEPPDGRWQKILDSPDKIWLGPGSEMPDSISKKIKMKSRALSFTLYKREG